MRTENQLLREAHEAIQGLLSLIRRDAPQLSGKTMGYATRVAASIDAALTKPTKPAEGGEAVGTVCGHAFARHRSELTVSMDRFVSPGTKLYTAPPASQELLLKLAAIAAECSDQDTTDALDQLIAATPASQVRAKCQHKTPHGCGKDGPCLHPYCEPKASPSQAQQPSMICKTCGADRFKEPCKNSTTCTMVGESQAQQPSGGEVVDEIRHLLEETWGFAATPPRGKDNISAALDLLDTLTPATPKPEPLPLPRLTVSDSHMASLIEAAIQGHASTRDAMRWLVRQLATKPEPMTWIDVGACPDGDVWFSLSCGHVVMGYKQGPLILDWEASIDHDCCADAHALKAQPVQAPAHHGITAPAGGEG